MGAFVLGRGFLVMPRFARHGVHRFLARDRYRRFGAVATAGSARPSRAGVTAELRAALT